MEPSLWYFFTDLEYNFDTKLATNHSVQKLHHGSFQHICITQPPGYWYFIEPCFYEIWSIFDVNCHKLDSLQYSLWCMWCWHFRHWHMKNSILAWIIYIVSILIRMNTQTSQYCVRSLTFSNYVIWSKLWLKALQNYGKMCTLVVSTVTVDGLAPLGDRTSAASVMTKTRCCVNIY